MSTLRSRLSNLLAWLSFFWAIAITISVHYYIGYDFTLNIVAGTIFFLLPSIVLYFLNYLICGSLRLIPWLKIDSD